MGEVDTKPIESVQAALSLFGEKNDPRKYRSTSSEGIQDSEEKDLDLLLKDLANYKVQVEVKESAYKQALLKLDIYQQVVDELSTKLKTSEARREKHLEECREARNCINELESKIKDLSDQLVETEKNKEQLLCALNELKATQEELLDTKAELAAIEESKLAATIHAEIMEIAVIAEKERTEELLKRTSELNEAILLLKLAVMEAEKEKSTLSDREHVEEMRKQMEMIEEWEKQLLAKTILIDSLQLELNQVKESHSSSAQAASDAINDLNQLKSELELSKRVNADQAIYVKSMETELNQLKLELENANEEVSRLSRWIEMLTGEINNCKGEMDEIRGQESEAQVEIAMLKAELHKGRSKLASAQAAEARAKSVKSGLYRAVQQLALEADEAKKESRRLRQEAEETGSSFTFNSHFDDFTQELEVTTPQVKSLVSMVEERRDGFDPQIMISMLEYESLIRKAEKADQAVISPTQVALNLIASDSESELDALKKKLEASMAEIEELKCSAEKAVNRAEMAERAKEAVEDQLRKWREQKQRRRVALASLREESAPKESKPSKFEKTPSMYQPLGKVLNMKF
ncbi:WEB family [Macleaya cordata]|uniref:WEB family n=1 Tax=Macleaya cordata TaxID=56857 RepID=A0A200QSG2_MACCD|nr:WEB family [Macleaya cordata]